MLKGVDWLEVSFVDDVDRGARPERGGEGGGEPLKPTSGGLRPSLAVNLRSGRLARFQARPLTEPEERKRAEAQVKSQKSRVKSSHPDSGRRCGEPEERKVDDKSLTEPEKKTRDPYPKVSGLILK